MRAAHRVIDPRLSSYALVANHKPVAILDVINRERQRVHLFSREIPLNVVWIVSQLIGDVVIKTSDLLFQLSERVFCRRRHVDRDQSINRPRLTRWFVNSMCISVL